MPDLSITASAVGFVQADPSGQVTGPAGATIAAGEYVIQDPTTAKWALADGSALATATDTAGVAVASVVAGQALTVVRDGLVDLGAALDGLAPGAQVFLSDTAGKLADATGTKTKVVGVVEANFGNGGTFQRLLRVSPVAAFTP